MANFQDEMNRAVQQFVVQVTGLAQRAALETFSSAIGGAREQRPDARAPKSAPARVSNAPGSRRGKRTADDLERLAVRVLAFIRAHPGLRAEQLNDALGTTTKEVALPLRKLVSEGVLSTKGQRRATSYFVTRKGR